MLTEKLLQVFVEMTVVVVAVSFKMKVLREVGELLNGFSDPHDLQRLFAIDARGSFKIALQRAGTNMVLLREMVNGNIKVVLLRAVVKDLCYDLHLL